jgi:hypothetical protein
MTTMDPDGSDKKSWPDSFWAQCEHEFVEKVSPRLTFLSLQKVNLDQLRIQCDLIDEMLSQHIFKDPIEVRLAAKRLGDSVSGVQLKATFALSPIANLGLPAEYTSSSLELRQMLAKVTEHLGKGLNTISSQLFEEAARWIEASERSKREISLLRSTLCMEVEAIRGSIKEVSGHILATAEGEIRQAETQYEVEEVVNQGNVQSDGLKPRLAISVFTAAGAAGVVGSVIALNYSVIVASGIAVLSVALVAIGYTKIRSDLDKSAVQASRPDNEGSVLRRKIREISEVAERRVSARIEENNSQLELLKESLQNLTSNEQELNAGNSERAHTNLKLLADTKYYHACKATGALKAVCLQWTKLAHETHNQILEDWKCRVYEQATILSFSGMSNEVTENELSTLVPLGKTDYAPPERIKDLLGSLVITVPFNVSFEDSSLAVQPGNELTGIDSEAVCLKLILELALVLHGKLKVRLWDPQQLGANYPQIFELAQAKPSFVDKGRALTTSRELENTLAALQKLTADRTAILAKRKLTSWIDTFENSKASGEDFELLFVVGFPAGFSEQHVVILKSIAFAGPKCGIYVLFDSPVVVKNDTDRDYIRKGAANLLAGVPLIKIASDGKILFGERSIDMLWPDFDLVERARKALSMFERLNDQKLESGRAMSPLGDISFEDFRKLSTLDSAWKASSKEGLEVRLGLGLDDEDIRAIRFDNTTPHALLLGGTGSGKSNLLHSVVQGLALDYSPKELSLYLADLKDGVEFSRYTRAGRLPHAAAIAATADPRYAVALIKAAAEELTRRNKLFVASECANFEKYRSMQHFLPRILLVIDEFQVLFEDRESAISVKAALINLCKQGRSAGIHLLLASQSLKGKAGDIDEVLGLIQSRILMKISEADARRAVSNSEMATRAAIRCSRRGIGCFDTEFGSGEELYFRNPFVDENEYFFKLIQQHSSINAHECVALLQPVVWKDEPGDLHSNPLFSQLEGESRRILIGESYALEHAVEFSFSKTRAECIAIAGGSAVQQLSILNSIIASARQTCGASIRTTFIRNSDSVLDRRGVQSLLSGGLANEDVFEAPHIHKVLSDCQMGIGTGALTETPAFHLLLVLGSSELTFPKRSTLATIQSEKAGTLSDSEILNEILLGDANGSLQIVFACRNPSTFVDQLSVFKDRVSTRIFGQTSAGGRLRDFIGLSEHQEVRPQDMGLIRQGDIGVSIFKPFWMDSKVAQ